MESSIRICEYGCNNTASFYLHSVGKWCCSKSSNGCPAVKNRKKSIEIDSNELCYFGCGRKARFKLKNNKLCCCNHHYKCPKVKEEVGKFLRIVNMGRLHNEDTKKLMSESRKGKNNPMYGKHHTDETKKKIGFKSSQKVYTDEYREKIRIASTGRKHTVEGDKKFKETMESLGFRISDGDLSDFKLYKRKVLFYTKKSKKEKFSKEELSGIGRGRDKKHIDHIVSITEGFNKGILPMIIGSKSNIRILDSIINCKKFTKSDMTIDELYCLFQTEGV